MIGGGGSQARRGRAGAGGTAQAGRLVCPNGAGGWDWAETRDAGLIVGARQVRGDHTCPIGRGTGAPKGSPGGPQGGGNV